MNRESIQINANLADDAYIDRTKDQYDPDKDNRISINGQKFKVLKVHQNPTTGFYGAVYQDVATNEITVAYRGTEPWAKDSPLLNKAVDIWTDAKMVLSTTNNQRDDAYKLTQWAVDKVHKINKN